MSNRTMAGSNPRRPKAAYNVANISKSHPLGTARMLRRLGGLYAEDIKYAFEVVADEIEAGHYDSKARKAVAYDFNDWPDEKYYHSFCEYRLDQEREKNNDE